MKEGEIQRLVSQLRSLLEQHQVDFWAQHLAELEEQFKIAYASNKDSAKRDILDKLDELYGGMGSFNDVVITSQHGDAVARDAEVAVNEQLNNLRQQLYQALQEERVSFR
jgi:hypothetical protein